MDFSKVGAYLDSLIEDGQPIAEDTVKARNELLLERIAKAGEKA